MKLTERITKTPAGGTIVTVCTFHGNVLFKKGFTHRLWRVGKNLGAWHILGFRFTFWTGNYDYAYQHANKSCPPVFPIRFAPLAERLSPWAAAILLGLVIFVLKTYGL